MVKAQLPSMFGKCVELDSIQEMTRVAKRIMNVNDDGNHAWFFHTDAGDLSIGHLKNAQIRIGDTALCLPSDPRWLCKDSFMVQATPRPPPKQKRVRRRKLPCKPNNAHMISPSPEDIAPEEDPLKMDPKDLKYDVETFPSSAGARYLLRIHPDHWDDVLLVDILKEGVKIPLISISSHHKEVAYGCTFVKPDGSLMVEVNVAQVLMDLRYPDEVRAYWEKQDAGGQQSA